ncbi:alpha/beta hydrolase [Paenibacillus sp. SYP-B4298]|uniref:alpha/beta hydrolase n=1 Tax=Paenibacillus sp. SYP-B4298 TaxID=2996034 RepID=UPI0022DD17FA|nr:alpha/beta hydrolase [Paenibacillus sp. SYP-B4298]
MHERLIEINAPHGRLAAVLHHPGASAEPPSLVIYCPGKNGERSDVHRLGVNFARRAAALGIAVLRFDYSGVGLSDGDYHEMTVSSKVSDTIAVYRYACGLPDLNTATTAFLGFSDGARTALLAANQTGVNRLILWSPLFQEWGGGYPQGRHPRFVRHPLHPLLPVMPWAGLWVGMPFYKDLQQLDLPEQMRSYNGTSIVIYGEEDPLVAEERIRMDTESLPLFDDDSDHRVCAIPQADHLFASIEHGECLLDHTLCWLRSHA